MKDVVCLVGVFILIVFYVINKDCFVSEVIIVKVEAVIKEFNYVLLVLVCSFKFN